MLEASVHEHLPRFIRWPAARGFPAGEASLTANGNWVWAYQVANNYPIAVRLEECPGCGTPLWGLQGTPEGWKAGLDAGVLA